jgi:hypothetical protein
VVGLNSGQGTRSSLIRGESGQAQLTTSEAAVVTKRDKRPWDLCGNSHRAWRGGVGWACPKLVVGVKVIRLKMESLVSTLTKLSGLEVWLKWLSICLPGMRY